MLDVIKSFKSIIFPSITEAITETVKNQKGKIKNKVFKKSKQVHHYQPALLSAVSFFQNQKKRISLHPNEWNEFL